MCKSPETTHLLPHFSLSTSITVGLQAQLERGRTIILIVKKTTVAARLPTALPASSPIPIVTVWTAIRSDRFWNSEDRTQKCSVFHLFFYIKSCCIWGFLNAWQSRDSNNVTPFAPFWVLMVDFAGTSRKCSSNVPSKMEFVKPRNPHKLLTCRDLF